MFLKQRLLLLLTPLVLIPCTILGVGLLYISEAQTVFSSFDETLLKITIVVFFIVIVSIALMVIRGTAQAISSPIQEAVFHVARIARGERDVPIVVEDAQGEVAELIDNLGQMQTDIVKYEMALQKKTEIELMGRVASQVAHDIRSPLSVLQSSVNLLQNKEAAPEKQQDALNLLRLSGGRLEKIANDLLAKYKGIQTEAEMFSIHELLDVLVGEIQASPLGTGVEFKKQYWSSAIHMKGDYSTIQRSIHNIIKNGIEAMRVCQDDRNMILMLRTVQQHNSLEVRISDNGMGIDPDKISKIIEGGYTEGKENGHGLGMQVAHDTMRKHLGEIRVESTLGAGTSFILLFPTSERDLDEIQSNEVLSLPSGDTFIIIDDDVGICEQWRLTLTSLEVTPIIYNCWEEFLKTDPSALSQADKGPPFIVDYHFDNSEIDGLTIIRRLKERGFGNFVLATAEYWKPAIKDAAQQLGITLCPKPLPKIVIERSKATKQSTISNDKGYTVLVIDDDATILLAWELMDRKLQIEKLHTFASWEAAESAKLNWAAIDIAFVDKNIDGSLFGGAAVVQLLKSHGVAKVILASGENSEALRKDPQFAAADFVIREKIPTSFKDFFS